MYQGRCWAAVLSYLNIGTIVVILFSFLWSLGSYFEFSTSENVMDAPVSTSQIFRIANFNIFLPSVLFIWSGHCRIYLFVCFLVCLRALLYVSFFVCLFVCCRSISIIWSCWCSDNRDVFLSFFPFLFFSLYFAWHFVLCHLEN